MRLTHFSFFCIVLLALTSCADTEWPQWISGEPTREQLNAYKGPIAMPNPDTEGKVWPNLADVPERPKVLLQDDAKEKLVGEMNEKNIQANAEIARYIAKTSPVVKPTSKKLSKKSPSKKTSVKKKKKHRHVK